MSGARPRAQALRGRCGRLTIAACLALAIPAGGPSSASAQDVVEEPTADAPEDTREGDVAAGSAETLDPATVSRAPEELPEGADLGPPLSERPPLLSPEEQRRERQRNYDPTEPQHPLALQIHLAIGGALDSSLDHALEAHRYGDSIVVFSGDIGLLSRITEWLYIGGRLGGRGRGWLSNEVSPAAAGGVDAMAIAHARAYLGRVVDLGLVLGAGLGWGGISLERSGAAGVAPRLHASALIAFRLDSGIRLCARFAWDWFSLYDIDRYGSDLELGGPSLGLGLEIRR